VVMWSPSNCSVSACETKRTNGYFESLPPNAPSSASPTTRPSTCSMSRALGLPRATSASPRPIRCRSSRVRACMPSARDSWARSSARSMIRARMPNDRSCAASARPVGPAPTIRMSAVVLMSYPERNSRVQ
jgi:hypothetical protein